MMRNFRRWVSVLLFGSLIFSSSLSIAQDSLRLMTLQDAYGLVLANHPMAKLAATFPEVARQEVVTARGAFDPTFKSVLDQKEFDDKSYWNTWQSALVVPLWPGIDVRLKYDQNTGVNLDPTEVTPENGLTYAGFSVPIGQGLLMDQRRATLQQARLTTTIAVADQVKAINKLLWIVSKDYWDWSFTYQRKRLHEESLRLAQIRFEAIRDRVLFGDQPAIDSLEAFIEVQNRENILNQSTLEYMNARLLFSNHLWSNDGTPVELAEFVFPQSSVGMTGLTTVMPLEQLLDSARLSHPELVKWTVKIQQLDVERRLAGQKLLPKVDLDYNFLAPQQGIYPFEGYYSLSFQNNYRFGLSFSMPLFLRQERGKLQQARIKINQSKLEQDQVSRTIVNEVKAAYNELTMLNDQIRIQEAQVVNAEKMLEGEMFRFSEGESMLFLVNNRENTLIGSRIKLAELQTKLGKSVATVNWSAGQLWVRGQ